MDTNKHELRKLHKCPHCDFTSYGDIFVFLHRFPGYPMTPTHPEDFPRKRTDLTAEQRSGFQWPRAHS